MRILLEEEIEHKVFGKGKVISQEAETVVIDFSEPYGVKKFLYPDAFETHLKLADAGLEQLVLAELWAKQEWIEAEKMRKQQEYEAVTNSMTLEKAKLAKKKKSVSKSKAAVATKES